MASVKRLTIASLLRRYRRVSGLNQVELATRDGIGVNTVSALERGVRQTPHSETIALLADALHLAPADLAFFEVTARGRAVTRSPLGSDPAHQPPVTIGAQRYVPLVGRTHELVLVERHLAGQLPPLLMVAGEPGIGKSRLLAEAAQRAHASGWTVLFSGCHRKSGQEPYAPLLVALAEHLAGLAHAQAHAMLEGCGWLVRLLPELVETLRVPTPTWTLPPEQERRLMFHAVGRYLANVAGPAGTLLLLDDLQWAGADALELLASLIRTPRNWSGHAVRVIGAYRDTEVRADDLLTMLLADLAREGQTTHEPLPPLTSAEAVDLFEMLLRDGMSNGMSDHLETAEPHGRLARISAARREEALRRAEGIPFFLVSSAQALLAETTMEDELPAGIPADLAPAGPGAGRIPWSVAQSIRVRAAALSAPARALLGAAAIVGRALPATLLVPVTAQPEAEILAALDETCAAGLLVERGRDYQFAHDLIREVVLADLSAARQQALHRRVAAALEQLPARERKNRVTDLADHLLEAHEPARALPYVLQAGDLAEAVYAHAEAESHYRAALALSREQSDHACEAEALEKLGKCVLLQGHGHAAAEALERALRSYQSLSDQDGELRALAALLDAQAVLGRSSRDTLDETLARAQMILTRLEPADASALTPALASLLAAVYSPLSKIYFLLECYNAQLHAAKRGAELARLAGNNIQLAWALHRLRLAEEALGHVVGRDLLDHQLALVKGTSETDIAAMAYSNIAEELQYAGEFAQMLSSQEQSTAMAERRQDPRLLAGSLQNLAERAYYLGDWQRAREVDARFAAILREIDRDDRSWESAGILLWPGMLTLAEGREDEGRRLLVQASERSEKVGASFLLAQVTSPLAEADLLAGHPEQARLRITSILQRPAVVGRMARIVLPYLVWAEGALGDEEQAEARLATLLASAEPLIRVDALRVQGLLATLQGRWAVASAALDEALERTRAMPFPYAEAKTLWVYGQLEAARGDSTAAQSRFEQALAICDQLGEGLYRTHIKRGLASLHVQ
jgi:transcriptional regulator with XRE-family HTH domain